MIYSGENLTLCLSEREREGGEREEMIDLKYKI